MQSIRIHRACSEACSLRRLGIILDGESALAPHSVPSSTPSAVVTPLRVIADSEKKPPPTYPFPVTVALSVRV